MILVSNAPIPASGVERVLEKTGVRRDAWDAIVSSGDIALRHIAAKGYRRMHWVGPSERDYALYVRLPGPEVPACRGRGHRLHRLEERPHRNRGGLPRADRGRRGVATALRVRQSRSCGGRRHPAPHLRRVIAAEYERQGGEVFRAGKPHPAAYARRCSAPASCAAATPDLSRILAIGDAVRTDLAAAQGLGVDGLFVAAGIHGDAVLVDGEIDAGKLAALFGPPGTPPAVAAMTHLRW